MGQDIKIISTIPPAIIWIFDTRNGTYEFIHESIRPILGYSPSDFRKNPVPFPMD